VQTFDEVTSVVLNKVEKFLLWIPEIDTQTSRTQTNTCTPHRLHRML